MHLSVANVLTLLCKGIPKTIGAFGLKDFLSDFQCKLLFYLHRVSRVSSTGSTCFLSAFQVITISPRDLKRGELEAKSSKNIGSWIYLSWILNFLMNVIVVIKISGREGDKNITTMEDFKFGFAGDHGKSGKILHTIHLIFFDHICVVLMLWARSSMVHILENHKQRMQHMQ